MVYDRVSVFPCFKEASDKRRREMPLQNFFCIDIRLENITGLPVIQLEVMKRSRRYKDCVACSQKIPGALYRTVKLIKQRNVDFSIAVVMYWRILRAWRRIFGVEVNSQMNFSVLYLVHIVHNNNPFQKQHIK